MSDAGRVRISHHGDEWSADCLICNAWSSNGNAARRDLDLEIGRHLHHAHGAEGRLGVVFIAWTDDWDDIDGRYCGYWDGAGDGGMLEQMPETPTLDNALAWANARADRVRIRPNWDAGTYYEAGTVLKPGEPVLRRP